MEVMAYVTLSTLKDLHHAALGGSLSGYAQSELRTKVEFLIGHGEDCGCRGRRVETKDARSASLREPLTTEDK